MRAVRGAPTPSAAVVTIRRVAVHRLRSVYDIPDDQALYDRLREIEAKGEKITSVQYFAVGPISSFVIVTSGAPTASTDLLVTADDATPAPAGRGKAERRTRSRST